MSLCKCHFVSSGGRRKDTERESKGGEFTQRDATPFFALLGLEKGQKSIHRHKEGTTEE